MTTQKVRDEFGPLAEEFAKLRETILSGWPYDELPTDAEAKAIETIFGEHQMHDPDMSTMRAWFLAGQFVARLKRDGLVLS